MAICALATLVLPAVPQCLTPPGQEGAGTLFAVVVLQPGDGIGLQARARRAGQEGGNE
jgi:hypothetical protein